MQEIRIAGKPENWKAGELEVSMNLLLHTLSTQIGILAQRGRSTYWRMQ
jgi:hypothetical protein